MKQTLFFLQDIDFRKITIFFSIIKTVTDNEFVRDYYSLIVYFQIHLAPGGLIQDRADLYACTVLCLEQVFQVCKRKTCIYQILHQQDVFSGYIVIYILEYPYYSGRYRGIAVAGA